MQLELSLVPWASGVVKHLATPEKVLLSTQPNVLFITKRIGEHVYMIIKCQYNNISGNMTSKVELAYREMVINLCGSK